MLESRAALRLHLSAAMVLAGLASGAGAAAERAEVQVNVCTPAEAVIAALAAVPRGTTELWIFDTERQALARADVRVRLRVRGDRADLTVKVAGVDCARAQAVGAGKCEADLHGDALVDVLSLERSVSLQQAEALRRTPATLPRTLTAEQRQAVEQRAGALWPALQALGPMTVQAYAPAARDFIVEVWTLPDGTRLTEVSMRARRSEALAAGRALQSRLRAQGVEPCADQASQAATKLDALLRR